MNNLSDDLLVEAYHQAKALNLAPDFIRLIKREMEQRSLLLSPIYP
ncbi:antitoxin component HigA of HigAB toxin-antitoxin module [Virgibacillus natechei]|uniref:Antitoxin component HigA of HigAB toxin-antitoxin module n=1 Tax=Virgibacillus natechei TaxID=1216297 RepID=A0ABS4IHT3_9BACI|nr:sporulation histidine kinase inhibitor Sda [Virgibacillus natechei]MBP1970513.1 antitoxin component HigA of HigAB toxin-antitoxin module [Virgibacillus natechei]UZD14083.1 sporulation histidine kinase inhibitor Sda [Virgibacillus natechei]